MRKYYVYSDEKCKFEAMTKEQIYEAIAEATGNTPTPVDEAFISTIKEQNADKNVKIWKGTEAQFNALEEKSADTLYIIGTNEVREAQTTIIERGIIVDDNVTISGNSYASFTGSVLVKEGFEPVGIIEVGLSNASEGGSGVTSAAINRFYIDSNNRPFLVIKNVSSNGIKIQAKVSVIFRKID